MNVSSKSSLNRIQRCESKSETFAADHCPHWALTKPAQLKSLASSRNGLCELVCEPQQGPTLAAVPLRPHDTTPTGRCHCTCD